MRRPGDWAFFAAVLYNVFSFLVAVSEIPVILPQDRSIYFPLKLSSMLLVLPGAMIVRRNMSSFAGNFLVGLSLMLYCAVGAWYRPLYAFAYAELFLTYAFVFTPPPLLFYPFVFGGGALMSAIVWIRWDYLLPLLSHPSYGDIPLTLGAFGAVAVVIYLSFSRERVLREAALNRFGLLGQHASILVHDVKGQLTIPMMQIGGLKRMMAHHDMPEAIVSLGMVEASLTEISRVIKKINLMGKLAEEQADWFSVREIVEDTRTLLQPKLSTLNFKIEGDFECLGVSSLLSSVILALMVNSIEAFTDRKVEDAMIQIEMQKGRLLFRDNGGGFSVETLQVLRSGRPTSDKVQGSGLGLFLVRTAMSEMGGSARFSNDNNCAVVHLSFPSRLWREGPSTT